MLWLMDSEVQSVAGWLQGRNSFEEGHGGRKLLTDDSQEGENRRGQGLDIVIDPP